MSKTLGHMTTGFVRERVRTVGEKERGKEGKREKPTGKTLSHGRDSIPRSQSPESSILTQDHGALPETRALIIQ